MPNATYVFHWVAAVKLNTMGTHWINAYDLIILQFIQTKPWLNTAGYTGFRSVYISMVMKTPITGDTTGLVYYPTACMGNWTIAILPINASSAEFLLMIYTMAHSCIGLMHTCTHSLADYTQTSHTMIGFGSS